MCVNEHVPVSMRVCSIAVRPMSLAVRGHKFSRSIFTHCVRYYNLEPSSNNSVPDIWSTDRWYANEGLIIVPQSCHYYNQRSSSLSKRYACHKIAAAPRQTGTSSVQCITVVDLAIHYNASRHTYCFTYKVGLPYSRRLAANIDKMLANV